MSTYLELTNELLRRTLDTELTASNFASATSTQATAKDLIKIAVDEIFASEEYWPFAYMTGEQLLSVGVEQYALPSSTGLANNAVDWKSFRIEKDDTLGINTTPLELISHDEWKMFLRQYDEDSEADGRGVPKYVFVTNGAIASDNGSFGISPSPNEAYTVLFDYYVTNPDLSAYDDEVLIPSRFNFVIINFALKHFNMFKDNSEQATFWTSEAKKSLKSMRDNLLPRQDAMRSTVVNFGGNEWRSTSYVRR
jgi:hypothetical protein